MIKQKLLILLAIAIIVLISGCTNQPGSVKTVNESESVQTANQPGSVQTCDTSECFVTAANTCSPATFTSNQTFGIVEFSSTSSCTLTKKIVSISNETPTLKSILDNKSMACPYERGAFDSKWLKYLTLGAENCDGELKELLGELLPIYSAQVVSNLP